MSEHKFLFFSRTVSIERKIDEFMDVVSQAGMVFEESITNYLRRPLDEIWNARIEQICKLEMQGDKLRHDIELELYTEMLIPESRGDVLSLLDDLDDLTDLFKINIMALDIERPVLPKELHDDFEELCRIVVRSVESVLKSSRSFFRNINAVRDYAHKTAFLESEADRIATHLKKTIFQSDIPLEEKIYLRDWIVNIDEIADEAENVSDRVTIYAVKRSL